MSTTHLLVLLSVILAVVVIAVLAAALIEVRRGLTHISEGLGTLGSALEGVEAELVAVADGGEVVAGDAVGTNDPSSRGHHSHQFGQQSVLQIGRRHVVEHREAHAP